MNIIEDPGHLARLVEGFNQAGNLEFIVDAAALPPHYLTPARRTEVETFLKKMAVYADKIIFLLSDINEGDASQSRLMLARVDELTTAKIASLALQGIFYFLPSKIVPQFDEVQDLYDDGGMSGDARVGNPSFEFPYQYKNHNGYYVDLNDFQITAHLFEKRFAQHGIPRVLNYWLPDIRNIPFNVFLKIREDEQDAFARFQYALKTLLKETNRVDSAEKLKEVFERVDYEVRAFQAQMEKVRKSRALKSYEMLLGISVVGIGLGLHTEIVQIIASLLGSYSVKDFLENLLQEKDKLNDLRCSDFYIPYRLNEMNLKYR